MKTKIISILMAAMMLSFGSLIADTEKASEEDCVKCCYYCPEEDNEPINWTHVERRESNPFQVQMVLTTGPSMPNGGAPGGGVHLGYQLSNAFYLGWTSSAFFEGRNIWDDHRSYRYEDDDDHDHWDHDKVYGQDGVKKIDSELDPIHLMELRITPWDFGLYFSLGAMYRGKQTSTTTYKKDTRTIGENEYDTALTAEVEYKEMYAGTLGIGFNYIFNSGFTLGTALNLGLNAQTPDVTVSATENVSEEDLDYWKKQIEHNERQIPYLFTMSLGYAF